ncbi:MAG: hypothetical protein KAS12_01795 [Candidatus Aenigmarchaeota archaeon]|nr:hypothetical protein [Candidatus Aenigmarchaeota archaeon]
METTCIKYLCMYKTIWKHYTHLNIIVGNPVPLKHLKNHTGTSLPFTAVCLN